LSIIFNFLNFIEVIRNTFSRNQNGSIRRKNQQESDFEQTTEINQYTSSQLQQQQQVTQVNKKKKETKDSFGLLFNIFL
jgi:hypothetical protein